jgi:hypothetical protein
MIAADQMTLSVELQMEPIGLGIRDASKEVDPDGRLASSSSHVLAVKVDRGPPDRSPN